MLLWSKEAEQTGPDKLNNRQEAKIKREPVSKKKLQVKGSAVAIATNTGTVVPRLSTAAPKLNHLHVPL